MKFKSTQLTRCKSIKKSGSKMLIKSHTLGRGPLIAATWLCCLVASSLQQSIQAQYFQQQAANPFAPTIIPFSFNQNVQENQRAIVMCTTSSGEIPLNYTWSKDGQVLTPPIAQMKRIQIKNDQDSSTLKISTVRLDHAGNYTCFARNKHGSQLYQAQLIVHGEPRWLREPPHEPLVATRGQTVVIDCQTTGWPKPQQSWQIKSEYSLHFLPGHFFAKCQLEFSLFPSICCHFQHFLARLRFN